MERCLREEELKGCPGSRKRPATAAAGDGYLFETFFAQRMCVGEKGQKKFWLGDFGYAVKMWLVGFI